MLKSTNSLQKSRLIMEPKAGSDVYECRTDAVTLAIQNEIDVQFKHNSTMYYVNVGDLMDCCVEKIND